MKKQKRSGIHTVRAETSKKQILGERHNVESGSGHVKTMSSKIPKIPTEKIDIVNE